MNPNLQSAIIEFLANEYHLDPQKVTVDLNFQTDLNLTPDQIADLLQRLQDALNFSLPEEKIEGIITIADLFAVLAESEEEAIPYTTDQ